MPGWRARGRAARRFPRLRGAWLLTKVPEPHREPTRDKKVKSSCMCGIAGLLSSLREVPLLSPDEYLEHLSLLLGFRPDRRTAAPDLERALFALREARRHGYRLVSRAGCLALHLESTLVDRLRAAALMV